jgi:hypothetical protein
MSSITHWRLYLACPVGEKGEAFVVISEQQAKQLQEAMVGVPNTTPRAVVTGRNGAPDPATYRTIYVNPSQVVALEPRDD